MPKRLKLAALSVALLFSSACNLLSSPATPVAEDKPTAAAPLPTYTEVALLPSATASQAPTALPPTQRPSPLPPTATPAPARLNATGPFVLFGGSGGVWIANPDGSFVTRLSEQENLLDLHRAISPQGDRLALLVRKETGLDLVLMALPGGEVETTLPVLRYPEGKPLDPTSSLGLAELAIAREDSVAWQPGSGRLLAFMGASQGPTADLYLYDTQTQNTTQLTDGPSHGIQPSWSPDGQYILHYGVSWTPPFGGAIAAPNRLDGVWAVRISDEEVITLPRPKGVSPNFLGWLDDSHYLTYDSDDTCYAQKLQRVEVPSGKTAPVADFSFYYYIARTPQNGAILFSSAPGCASSLGEGTFFLLPGQGTAARLLDKRAWEIRWMPESQVFFAYPEALLSADGNTRYEPPVYDSSFEPAVSPQGYQAWEVIQNQQGRVMIRASGDAWLTILEGSTARELIWDPAEGKTLFVALEDGSLYAATYPEFAPQLVGKLKGITQAAWLP